MNRTGERGVPVLLALVLILAPPALAIECPVAIRPSANLLSPDISGSRIVWYDSGTRDIFSYDLLSGTEERLTSNGAEKMTPLLGDTFVAWEEVDPVLFTTPVTLLDLQTRDKTTLASNPLSHAVSDGSVIWKDWDIPDILYYNTSSQGQGILVNDVADRFQPAISGDRAVWVNSSCADVPGCTSAMYLKSISTGEEIRLAADLRDRASPVISGNGVAWADNRAGINSWHVYLIRDITNPAELQVTDDPLIYISLVSMEGDRLVWSNGTTVFYNDTSGTGSLQRLSSVGIKNDLPRISGNHVVWEKNIGGNDFISLYTIDAPSGSSCPVADFGADLTSGKAPFTVQFTDRSWGTPTNWSWDFGDGGTSLDPSPSHTYLSAGIFSVTLTVSNDFGRDVKTETGYIHTDTPPTASFTTGTVSGIKPLTVAFHDTSTGAPTGLSWDFENDGTTDSDKEDPVHTYDRVGNYTVNLTATNSYGSNTTIEKGLIWVMNGMNATATTSIDGLDIQNLGGTQHFTLDTTKVLGNTTGNTTWLSFQPQESTGWQNITFISKDSMKFQENPAGTIEGDIGSCIFESRKMIPSMFLTDTGNNLPVSYRLRLSSYPVGAEINATIWEKVTPADESNFNRAMDLTSPYFTYIIDTAYTLVFVSTNINPQNVVDATLNLSVSSAWVQKYGNQNNITVVRLGDNLVNETLNPSATFTDGADLIDYYIIPSPHGLSKFSLISAMGTSNLIQMGARVAQQVIQSSGMGYSSTQPSVKDRIPWEQPAPQAKAPESPPATYYGEGKLDTTPAGITRAPVIIKSEDWGAGLAIDAGTEAFDSTHQPLALVTARVAAAGSVPPVPEGAGIVFTGMAYDLGPDGATFNPPATLSFTVPESQWNADTLYSIKTYTAAGGTWEGIPTTVDVGTRGVSAPVAHLCLFGLFASPAAKPPTPAPTLMVPAATPQPQEKPLPRTPMGTFTGLLSWIYSTATANLAASSTSVLALLAAMYAYTRRSWLGRYRPWVSLYLASLTGILWASFLLSSEGPVWETYWILITVAGLNLIVHALRFDRIDLSSRARAGYVTIGRR